MIKCLRLNRERGALPVCEVNVYLILVTPGHYCQYCGRPMALATVFARVHLHRCIHLL